MGVQDEVIGNDSAGNILLIIYRYRLGNAMPMRNHVAEVNRVNGKYKS